MECLRLRWSSGDGTAPPSFEIGSVVDGVFRIEQELGSGSFSRVYKVFHLDHGRNYTMKLLKNSNEVDLLLREYNVIGQNLPSHPNIAKMVWMARLAPPLVTPYILNEYVEGETLEPYCDGRKSLSWKDIQKIGLQILDALDALHPKTREFEGFREQMQKRSLTAEEFAEYQRLGEQMQNGILHRDIKPANILLELPSHKPKLIDFNIASRLAEAQGRRAPLGIGRQIVGSLVGAPIWICSLSELFYTSFSLTSIRFRTATLSMLLLLIPG